MKTNIIETIKKTKDKVIDYTSHNKKKVIIGSACVIVGLAALTISAVWSSRNNDTDKKITNEDVSISGAIGRAVTISKTEVDDTSDDYSNVKDKIDAEGLLEVKVYDISLYNKQNEKVQPDGTVSITMKLPEELRTEEDEELIVYRTESDSSLTELECSAGDDEVTFNTEHFSIYTVAKYTKKKGLASLKTDGIDPYVVALDKTMYTLADGKFMSGPNSTFDVVGTFVKNQEVHVVGEYQENGWYKVEISENVFGYVSSESLTEQRPSEPVINSSTPGENTGSNESLGGSTSGDSSGASNGSSGTTEGNGNTAGGSGTGNGNSGSGKGNGNSGSGSGGNNGGQGTTNPGHTSNPTPNPNPDKQPEPEKEKPKKNNCPYSLLTWTTYQGHEGFFASNKQRSQGGKANDMEVELYLKKGSAVQSVQVGYFDDTGVVAFYY